MRNTKLKAARAEKDMTQKELADAAGTTRQTVNAIEQGDCNPTIRLCRAICAALGKTLDEIFGKEPQTEPTPASRDFGGQNYCERCKIAFSGGVCPACGSKKVRPPMANDLCFLAEKEQIWGEMLSDVLRQNDIPFLRKGALGAGLAMKIGPGMERYRFYVSYCDLNRARGAVEQLFGEDYG